MPIIQSSYRPPAYLFNGHLQTIAPFFGVKPDNTLYQTEKLELADGDFLELDWIKGGHDHIDDHLPWVGRQLQKPLRAADGPNILVHLDGIS